MALVAIEVRGGTDVVNTIHKDARRAHVNAIKQGLVLIERYHKRRWFIRGSMGFRAKGGYLKDVSTDKYRLTSRTGTLSKSYTRVVDEKALIGVYGSDCGYSRIHEFGGMAGPGRKVRIPARPGLQVTAAASANAIEQIFAKALAKEGL